MKVEITPNVIKDIEDFVESGRRDEFFANALVLKVYECIRDERKRDEAHIEDLVNSIQV